MWCYRAERSIAYSASIATLKTNFGSKHDCMTIMTVATVGKNAMLVHDHYLESQDNQVSPGMDLVIVFKFLLRIKLLIRYLIITRAVTNYHP